MKISKRTIDVLKNFSTMNPSILIKPGKEITTISSSKKIVASAAVEEEFDRQVGVYELAKLLGILSMLKEPEIEFGEKSATISSEGRTVEFMYSAPETIATPPAAGIKMPAPDAEFDLPAGSLKEIIQAAGVLGVQEIEMRGKDGRARVRALDVKNPSSHAFEIDLGEVDSDFRVVFKSAALKMIMENYRVSVSNRGLTKFEGGGLTYFVASETDR